MVGDRRCAMSAVAEPIATPAAKSNLGMWGATAGLCAAIVLLAFWPAKEPRPIDIPRSNHGFAKGFLAACGDPCIIRNNPGGQLGDYQALADKILSTGRTVIIDGYCAS